MKDNLSRYTLRVEQVLLDKLGYIAEYEGRTKNRELEQMVETTDVWIRERTGICRRHIAEKETVVDMGVQAAVASTIIKDLLGHGRCLRGEKVLCPLQKSVSRGAIHGGKNSKFKGNADIINSQNHYT